MNVLILIAALHGHVRGTPTYCTKVVESITAIMAENVVYGHSSDVKVSEQMIALRKFKATCEGVK